MTVKKSIYITATVTITSMLLLMTVFIITAHINNRNITNLVDKKVRTLSLLEEAKSDLMQMVASIRNVIINPKDENSKKNYQNYYQKFLSINEELQKFSSSQVKEELIKAQSLTQSLYTKMREIQEHSEKGEKELAIQKSTEVTRLFRNLRDNIFIKLIEKEKKEAEELKQNAYNTIKVNLFIFTGVFVVSLGIVNYFLIRTVKSIQVLPEMAQKLSEIAKGTSKGSIGLIKFDEKIEKRDDEIGLIARSIKQVDEFTFNVIDNVKKSLDVVNSVIDSLESNVENLKEKSNEQTGHSHHIATAAEQMNQTITDIARNASTASDLANNSQNVALEGVKLSDRASIIVNSANESTNQLKIAIESLNRRIEEIGDIVTFIKDIADQTNLLALNAAIEAARAGEQGRGFAVVADEVRRLAEKTIKSTEEIASKISAVQLESRESQRSMEITAREVSEALNALNEVKESLQRINEHSLKVKDTITQIATASEEQSSASDEIARSAELSSQIASSIRDISSVVSQEVNNLIDVVRKLSNSIKGINL